MRLLGGCRDRAGKEQKGQGRCPLQAAARLADQIIVTDDNPRGEIPETIRAAVRSGCPNAREIGDPLVEFEVDRPVQVVGRQL